MGKKKPTHIKFDPDGNVIDLKPSKTLNKVKSFLHKAEIEDIDEATLEEMKDVNHSVDSDQEPVELGEATECHENDASKIVEKVISEILDSLEPVANTFSSDVPSDMETQINKTYSDLDENLKQLRESGRSEHNSSTKVVEISKKKFSEVCNIFFCLISCFYFQKKFTLTCIFLALRSCLWYQGQGQPSRLYFFKMAFTGH